MTQNKEGREGKRRENKFSLFLEEPFLRIRKYFDADWSVLKCLDLQIISDSLCHLYVSLSNFVSEKMK